MPLGRNGDTYDRYRVRIEEMRQADADRRPVSGPACRTDRCSPTCRLEPEASRDAEVYHGWKVRGGRSGSIW